MLYIMERIEFADSAFRHGFDEQDFVEMLSRRYVKLSSQRGLAHVFEILGQNLAADYLHVVYRLLGNGKTIQVFHINKMTARQKRRFKRMIKR